MLRRVVDRTGRPAQWVLLACTLFGLATMHTLGHAGMHGPGHHHAAVMSGAFVGPTVQIRHGHDLAAAVTSLVPAHYCDSGCAHGPGRSPDGGMPAWGVCVAVLGALATLMVLTVLVLRRRRRERRVEPAASWAAASRSPPAPPTGLVVTMVSVLRV